MANVSPSPSVAIHMAVRTRGPIGRLAAALVALAGLGVAACDPPSRPAARPTPTPTLAAAPAQGHSAALARSGAAGEVLRCDSRIMEAQSGLGPNSGYPSGAKTPAAALAQYVGPSGRSLPAAGYRQVRSDGTRVLFAFDVAGRPRVAIEVVRRPNPRTGRAGWGVAGFAYCDVSEFPPESVPNLYTQVWTDRNGHRVATHLIQSYPGPAHCDWTSVTFLDLNDREQEYLRDPDGIFAKDERVPYQAGGSVPGNARDTGYRRNGVALWLTDDAAYVVGATVERWPRVPEAIGCM